MNTCNVLKNSSKGQNKENEKSSRWMGDSFLGFVIFNSKEFWKTCKYEIVDM